MGLRESILGPADKPRTASSFGKAGHDLEFNAATGGAGAKEHGTTKRAEFDAAAAGYARRFHPTGKSVFDGTDSGPTSRKEQFAEVHANLLEPEGKA